MSAADTAITCSAVDCDKPSTTRRGWCRTHYARWQRNGDPNLVRVPSECREYVRIPEADRFWAKVEKTETCWLWTGAKSDTGYGTIWTPSRGGASKKMLTHRWAYEALVGPIPDGLVLDHTCRVRECVNPEHLEAVTQQENVLRYTRTITHCPQGHEYTPENSYFKPNRQSRMCRECNRQQSRRWTAERAGRVA